MYVRAQDMEEAKRKHDEEVAKKAADKLRREQEEDRKYKEKLMEKLKQDKLNRDAAKVRVRASVCVSVRLGAWARVSLSR